MSEDWRESFPSKYCGQCGQMVKEDEVIACPDCLMVACRECGGQVTKCWYCGERWQGAGGDSGG